MTTQHADLRLKRAYDPAEEGDGTRVLIDRIWPRGVSKERARIDLWLKDVAPSTELRKWFGHEPEKYVEFARRYRAELEAEPGKTALARLRELARQGPLTLVYAARDTEHNDATVLHELLGEGIPTDGR
jgi:uncharacterized protein YeaO (DUF488 family)